MPDREKVISGLVCCIETFGIQDCEECPYRHDPNNDCAINRLLAEALAFLREQEPVKPYDNPLGYYRYGNCGTHVHKYAEQDNYCPKCGRKVLWDDDD